MRVVGFLAGGGPEAEPYETAVPPRASVLIVVARVEAPTASKAMPTPFPSVRDSTSLEEIIIMSIVNDGIRASGAHGSGFGITGYSADYPGTQMLAPLNKELPHAAGHRMDEHAVAGTNSTVLAHQILCGHGLEEESFRAPECPWHRNRLGSRNKHLGRMWAARINPRHSISNRQAIPRNIRPDLRTHPTPS